MFKKLLLWAGSLFDKKEEVKKVQEEVKKEVIGYATRHARQRVEERHGVVLTEAMVSSMVSDIQNEKAEFVSDKRQDTQSWIVTYENKKYRVIYNYYKKSIITVYSGTKNKRRKPGRKKKVRVPTGRVMKNHSYKDKRVAKKRPYKRVKKVNYEEVM